jgi:ComF family protein
VANFAAAFKPGARVRETLRAALDLVLPPQALDEGAGAAAVQTQGLSPDLWARIGFIAPPFCARCGSPFEYEMGEGAVCAACQSRKPAYDRARAACFYDEASRDLILKLKHADRTDLAALFARWIGRAAADVLADAEAVVPVPLHRWRLLRRRYNQAAEIARPLARTAGLAFFPDALARLRATETQGGKSGDARRRNVAAAFAVPPAWHRRIEGRRLVLVDDVLTTGATAEGCARALKAAGAARVDVAVIARVKDVTPRPI